MSLHGGRRKAKENVKQYRHLSCFVGLHLYTIFYLYSNESCLNKHNTVLITRYEHSLTRDSAGAPPVRTDSATYLKLGPLYSSNAAGRITPGQFGAKRQLRFSQVIRPCPLDFLLHRFPASPVRGGVQPKTNCTVIIHPVSCWLR